MKSFSVETLTRKAGETFLRFPLSIAAALAAPIVMVLVSHRIDNYQEPEPFLLYRLAMSCYLVMLLSISVSLYAERFTFSALRKNILFVAAIALGILYFLSLPGKVEVISS